jgi:hypothetical protein
VVRGRQKLAEKRSAILKRERTTAGRTPAVIPIFSAFACAFC